jgi:hypothetical protein
LNKIPPATIVGGHPESDLGVVLCLFLSAKDQVLQFRAEFGFVPKDFQANAIALHLVHFFLQITGKKAHQN